MYTVLLGKLPPKYYDTVEEAWDCSYLDARRVWCMCYCGCRCEGFEKFKELLDIHGAIQTYAAIVCKGEYTGRRWFVYGDSGQYMMTDADGNTLVCKDVKFYGFKLKSDNLNPNKCLKLLSNKRILCILSRIAQNYGDLISWKYFSCENYNLDRGIQQESAMLCFQNHKDFGDYDGAEIEFTLWENKKDPHVDFIVFNGYGFEGEGRQYQYSMNLENHLKDDIANVLLRYIEAYMERGIDGVTDYTPDLVFINEMAGETIAD
jgi:hypothetical protein